MKPKMKTYTKEELNTILEKHKAWANGMPCGERANLSGADIRSADFSNADLRDANFKYSDLRGVDFSNANLRDADLRYALLMSADFSNTDLSDARLVYAYLMNADLSNADLSNADLSNANLRYADLSNANISNADLSNTNISNTNLWYATLSNADLSYADLSNANIRYADLRYADLRNARNIPFIPMACPDTGSFIGWKKALSDLVPNRKVIVKLAIPKDAKRSSTTNRKCRCDKAKVLEIQHLDKNDNCDITEAYADYDDDFKYTVGETVSVENFEDDRHIECAPGIHFFINREEAVRY